jgi:hypothetical protein
VRLRDPFDRLLVAQAQVENISIVSNDAVLDRYGVSRLWSADRSIELGQGQYPSNNF